jgi:hypothetical protein
VKARAVVKWVLGPLLVAGVFFTWLFLTRPQAGEWQATPSAAKQPVVRELPGAPSPRPMWLGGAPADEKVPADINNLSDPNAQIALWKKRLARAEDVMANYRRTTRYPHESRPAAEHDDQLYPNRPIVEERRLKRPGEAASNKIVLRTSQERIFVVGDESVRFTLIALDGEGAVRPIDIKGAVVTAIAQDSKAPTNAPLPVAFQLQADGGYALNFTPSKQGFNGFAGHLRLGIDLAVDEQFGFAYFDLYLTPEAPALWLGSVREALEAGSLNLYLKVDVRKAGRYVVTGRLDDFTGAPFALLVFNGELTTGKREIRLHAFGKLINDGTPAFPLRLRDVDGFLLHEDAFPDRALMPRLPGLVHQTKRYALGDFSSEEWNSEERTRYLTEYQRDIELARQRLAELARLLPKPGG